MLLQQQCDPHPNVGILLLGNSNEFGSTPPVKPDTGLDVTHPDKPTTLGLMVA